ncbi:MAG: 3-deoxy-7-phosphoheptulonate synthase [Candidatus Ancillula trichonymphae]|jgi:3-deoxy-7-phosphoheptulonate synthase|nr:3-deoxy-7-phosphoheptulonate synthase [Candidatus Ancillula trichonymphae]
MIKTSDLRIRTLTKILPPKELLDRFPITDKHAKFILQNESEIADILNGKDDRLFCIIGPCSIHDSKAAIDYANLLAKKAKEHEGELLIIMRVYFEKPRTTLGWKGMINDPDINGTYNMDKGLLTARKVLLDVLDAGIGIGTEFLDPISPQYTTDTVSWGAIGARTTESQVHRQLVSGLSMPVGFKNTTSGSIQAAIDACVCASVTHTFLSVDKRGHLVCAETDGNDTTHIILRGQESGPNYYPEFVREALSLANLTSAPRSVRFGVVIDAAHGNSGKNEIKQVQVLDSIAERIAGGEKGITGIMMESFIKSGTQKAASQQMLIYGKSITDPCIDWNTTARITDTLADAIKSRRSRTK